MKNKLLECYKSNFNSSPIEIEEKEIEFIIKHDCECDYCGKSVFEMDDFPELLMEDGDLMCEECYDDQYRTTCPICEDSYDTHDGESEYEVVTEQDSQDYQQQPGIYHNDKLILPIRINYFKSIDVGSGYSPVYSDKICPECVEKMVRKDNYMKSDSIPCILLRRYENDDLFKDYTPDQLHRTRQRIIHQRITCRGLIETANKIQSAGRAGKNY